jgi:hypothetical protein
MKKKLFLILVALIVIGAATAGALYYFFPVRVSLFAAMTRNFILSWSAPRGTATTELNAAYKDARALALTPAAEAASDSAGDWPSGSGAKLVGIESGVISGLNFNKPIRRLAAAEGDNANDDRYSKLAGW